MSQDLNNRQLKALPALIASPTIKEGCKKAGVSVKQYYEWLKNPLFREQLKQKQEGVRDKTLSELEKAMTKAFNVLVTLLDSENEATRRLSAADLLSYGLRMKELTEIEDRLVSIEKIVLERRVYR